jgi:hypothetical protein
MTSMDPSQLMDPSILVPVAVVLVVVIGVAVAIVTMLAGKKKAQRRGQWVHAAYSIWTGGEDCGTWARDRAQKSLASWYAANGSGALWKVIAGLREGRTGNIAWDRIRALDLLRIGFAAGYVDAEQCEAESAKIGVELQTSYRAWEQLAQAFEQGMQSWQQSSGVINPAETGRVQKNLPKLRQEIWPSIAYDTRLVTDD